MSRVRRLSALVALALVVVSIWHLEAARNGLIIESFTADQTPVTLYRQPGRTGPMVVIAHGFAGSRQLMSAFSLDLARAGYTAVSFDFEGHGRNPVPMSGDVNDVSGTTQRLLAEIDRVIAAAEARLDVVTDTGGADAGGADGGEADGAGLALLGHSMASDIIVRQADRDARVATVVAVSMYSEAVSATEPPRLLIISGGWEPGLRAFALEALRQVDPEAEEGETVRDPTTGTVRRAVVAPMVEHVGVLFSQTTLAETRAWLDTEFGRDTGAVPVTAIGGWILLLLAGVIALGWPLAALLPAVQARPEGLDRTGFLAAVALPALVTPLLLSLFETRVLPVLVADYLALHFLVYGVLALAIVKVRGISIGPWAPLATVALVAFGVGVFGMALDRYVANFVPHVGRLPIIAAVAAGAVPFMIADAVVTEAGFAAFWRRLLARLMIFVSLAIAVALDFERLFFLIITLPVILAFFLIFGLMGRWVGRRTGTALAPGIALGLILAWSIGVTFPMFQAG